MKPFTGFYHVFYISEEKFEIFRKPLKFKSLAYHCEFVQFKKTPQDPSILYANDFPRLRKGFELNFDY